MLGRTGNLITRNGANIHCGARVVAATQKQQVFNSIYKSTSATQSVGLRGCSCMHSWAISTPGCVHSSCTRIDQRRQYTTDSPSSPIYEEIATDTTKERARKMVTKTFDYNITKLIGKVYDDAMNDTRNIKEVARTVETIRDDVQFYDAHNVAQLSWALARLNLSHAPLYKAMGKRLKSLAKDMTPQEVSNTTWAFANNYEYRRDYFYPLSHRTVESLDHMNLQAMVVVVRSFAKVQDKDHLLFAKVAKKIRQHYTHLTPTDMAGVVAAFAFAGQAIVGRTILPTLAKHTHVMLEDGKQKFQAHEIAMLVVNFEKMLVSEVSRPFTLAMLKHAESQYDTFTAKDRVMLRQLFHKSGWEQAFCMYPVEEASSTTAVEGA